MTELIGFTVSVICIIVWSFLQDQQLKSLQKQIDNIKEENINSQKNVSEILNNVQNISYDNKAKLYGLSTDLSEVIKTQRNKNLARQYKEMSKRYAELAKNYG